MKKLFKLDNINLNYNLNGNDISVLKNINFEIKKNERVALIGESGSGKTSLLMLMSGLENPSKGSIIFENQDFSKISEEQKTAIRKKKIGLVFQQFYLIPNYTALENVMFPMQINKIKNLCLAGGVALNCGANGKILKKRSKNRTIFLEGYLAFQKARYGIGH